MEAEMSAGGDNGKKPIGKKPMVPAFNNVVMIVMIKKFTL
jgi:hypothetical protein